MEEQRDTVKLSESQIRKSVGGIGGEISNGVLGSLFIIHYVQLVSLRSFLSGGLS